MKNLNYRDLTMAKEMAKYQDKWIAVSKVGGSEKIVASGDRITHAKREADAKGINNPAFRKVPATGKALIA